MPPTILVVDDEAPIREALRIVLADEGYDVRVATDGVAALALLGDEPANLVLSDMMMPRMDGMALLDALRERGDRTPVVLMSAAPRPSDLDGTAWLPKPFDLDSVLEVVAEVLATG